MATVTLSDAAADAVLTQVLTKLDAGTGAATIKLYTGTKPAKPDVAVSTQTLLGTLTCSDPAGAVSARALTFSAITQDSSADATGVATWARFADSAGVAVIDVDVGTTSSSAFLKMNSTNVVAGGPISISSCVITA